MMRGILCGVVCVGFALSVRAGDGQATLRQLADSYAAAPVYGVQLSPDGQRVSTISMKADGTTVVDVVSLPELATQPLLTAGPASNIDWCVWASTIRLLCAVYPFRQPFGNSSAIDLIGIDADGVNPVGLLTASAGQRRGYDRIVDLLADDPDHVLVEVSDGSTEPARLNIYTGDLEKPTEQAEQAEQAGWAAGLPEAGPYRRGSAVRWNHGWVSGGDGVVRVRVAIGENRGANRHVVGLAGFVFGRANIESDWVQLPDVLPYQLQAREARLGFGESRDELLYLAPHENRLTLYGVGLTAEAEPHPIMHDPDRNFAGLWTLGKQQRAVSVMTTDHRTRLVVFDERVADVQRDAQIRFPDGEVLVVGESWDQRYYLLLARDESTTGDYYRFDTHDGSLVDISPVYPSLSGRMLHESRAVFAIGPDADTAAGYLTLPSNADGPLPGVILSSEGMFTPAYWEYDFLAQYLAASGFAVFRVDTANHGDFAVWRGGSGWPDWQVAMSRIETAAQWLIDQQIVASESICVIGQRHDAQAAIVSVMNDPDRFRCIAAIGGTYDSVPLVPELTSSATIIQREARPEDREHWFGSPTSRVRHLQTPILMVHGVQDNQSTVANAHDYSALLSRQRKPHQLVVYPDADGEIRPPVHRADMLARIAEFLHLHTGNRMPAEIARLPR